MIVTFTSPRLTIHPEDVSVHLNDDISVLLSTPQQANQLADFIRAAAVHLEQQQIVRAERLDRDVAARVNLANVEKLRGLGVTLSGWPPRSSQPGPTEWDTAS